MVVKFQFIIQNNTKELDPILSNDILTIELDMNGTIGWAGRDDVVENSFADIYTQPVGSSPVKELN